MRLPGLLLLAAVLRAAGFYGPCVQADSLANTTLGPQGNQVSCRFRADPGGTLLALRPFLIWSFRKAGYHGGTGGILRVEIQEDDGSPAHLPSGRVLATSVQRLYLVPASDQFYPRITFDRQPVLRRGTLYHAVFSNTHPRGDVNFLSLNALFSRVADRPVQPGRRDEDWALLIRNRIRPAWTERRTPGSAEAFTPILEVDCDRGAQGLGYVEVWMGAPRPIGGPCRVGEAFTCPGPARSAAAVAVRVRSLRGSGGLDLRLETPAGKLLAQARDGGAGLAPTPGGSLGGCGWVRAVFPKPVRLEAGAAYRLVLAAPEAGAFEAFPLRKGADKGFASSTQFPEGHAEFNAGSGWNGWEQWGKANRLDSDLQFYFVLVDSDPGRVATSN